MAVKYYTHFLTAAEAAQQASEWSGIVELLQPLSEGSGSKELRRLLAQSFDLDSTDIRIIDWARLH
ncbi:MAG: hypothetical protein IPI06_09275 [Gammaproteobacteria bacterium]|nr:hypothetical protein [Gammaproteobacteria bacterium]